MKFLVIETKPEKGTRLSSATRAVCRFWIGASHAQLQPNRTIRSGLGTICTQIVTALSI